MFYLSEQLHLYWSRMNCSSFHLVENNPTLDLLKESSCQQVWTLTSCSWMPCTCSTSVSYSPPTDLLSNCKSLFLLLCAQTEENTLMKEALGRIKNPKEKNMCWQDGRLFDDKEDWVVDSCTKCTCQVVPSQEEICADSRWIRSDADISLIFTDGRSPRSCVTKLPAPQWPVPPPRLLTASAAPCVCVSTWTVLWVNPPCI